MLVDQDEKILFFSSDSSSTVLTRAGSPCHELILELTAEPTPIARGYLKLLGLIWRNNDFFQQNVVVSLIFCHDPGDAES